MFSKLYYKLKNFHDSQMKNKIITETYLEDIINSSIFVRIDDTNYYKDFVLFVQNMFEYITDYHKIMIDNKKNKKIIDKIINSNDIKRIETELSYRGDFLKCKNIILSNRFMKEVIEKSKKTLESNKDKYHNLTQYVSGYCWFNSKLSNNIKINVLEQNIINSINKLVNKVEPMSTELILFHGFEKYTNYGDSDIFNIGDLINLPGFLSKTISLKIAYNFALFENYFRPKILIVKYPIGSKQIHHDIKMWNNEFEFLTFSNEKLIIKDIIICYELIFRKITFYICEQI